MVTSTMTKLPHPVQAGLAPAALWASSWLVSTAAMVALIVALPVLVPQVVGMGEVSPLLWGVIPVLIAALWASRAARREALVRTPGALVSPQSHGPDSPTRLPGIAAHVLRTAAVATAALVVASRGTSPDTTVLALSAFAGTCGGLFVIDVARSVWTRNHSELVFDVVGEGATGAALAVATFIAATGDWSFPLQVNPAALAFLGVTLGGIGAVVAHFLGKGKSAFQQVVAKHRRGAAVADLTSQHNPAPTLRDGDKVLDSFFLAVRIIAGGVLVYLVLLYGIWSLPI